MPPRVITADPPLIERILDGNHTIWSEGLARAAYGRWQQAQLDSRWGRDHLSRVALVDGDELLASAKRYDFLADLGGTRAPVLGIGAVYTPPLHRSRGYARELLESLTIAAEGRGCQAAVLCSEIGPAFYEALGFSLVPRDEVVFEIAGGAPVAPGARPGRLADLPAMAALNARTGTPETFGLVRTAEFLEFGLIRRGRLAELSSPHRLEVVWQVVEAEGALAAYLIATRRPRGLVIEDCGDTDPSGARVAALVAELLGQPSFHPPLVHAWLPAPFRAWTAPALWHEASANLLMIKPLGRVPPPRPGRPITFWTLDSF